MSIHAAQIRAKLNIGSRNVKKAYTQIQAPDTPQGYDRLL